MQTGLLSEVYMKNKLDYSRELDIWIWSNKPEIVKSADFLFSKIMKNIGGKFDQNRVKNHLKVFLTDIFVAHKQDNKLFISFSRNKNTYRVSKGNQVFSLFAGVQNPGHPKTAEAVQKIPQQSWGYT